MTYYVGILDGKGDVWGVRIPDCPGAFGAGPTPEAAVRDAISGLTAWAEATLKDGDPLPAARSLAEIKADPDDAPRVEDGDAAVMIPLLLDAGRTVRANLTLDAGLLAAIDAEAARRGLTRSAFLASAARDKIGAV
jgi:predicted RNase H-like HicB family nuclease